MYDFFNYQHFIYRSYDKRKIKQQRIVSVSSLPKKNLKLEVQTSPLSTIYIYGKVIYS